MDDTIERLLADMAASAVPDGPHFAERTDALWREQQSENAVLHTEVTKANALLRIKDAKIRELKGQLADLKKKVFGANSDHNPDKGQPKMDQNNNGPSNLDNTPEDPLQHRRNKPRGDSSPRKPVTCSPEKSAV